MKLNLICKSQVLCLLVLQAASTRLTASTLTPSEAYPFAIVLTSTDIQPLFGRLVTGICAFRYLSPTRVWERVRIQVDEKNPRGEYVLENGLPFTANSDDGFIDDNDEVVLRPLDFGDSFTDSDLVKLSEEMGRTRSFFRLSLTDSNETGQRQLALGSCTGDSSLLPFVEFNPALGRVNTSHYEYIFVKKQAALLGHVALMPKGKILDKTELFAGSKFVMNFELPWYVPNFSLNDDNFSSEIECWRTGPIRTIVAVGVKLQGLLSVLNLHMFSELVFYENGLEIPTNIEFVFDPTSYFKSGTGIAYGLDFGKNLTWTFTSNLPKLAPMTFEELSRSKVHTAESYDEFWARVQVEDRAANVKVTVDQAAKKNTYSPMFFLKSDQKDKQLRKTWKWLPDLPVDLGVFLDMSKVEKGQYSFNLDLKIVDSDKTHFFEATAKPKVQIDLGSGKK